MVEEYCLAVRDALLQGVALFCSEGLVEGFCPDHVAGLSGWDVVASMLEAAGVEYSGSVLDAASNPCLCLAFSRVVAAAAQRLASL